AGGERRLLCVSVHDTGPGFPASMRDRFGRPFAAAPGSTGSTGGPDGTGGTGLGLSSVVGILARAGGTLELADTPEQHARPGQGALPGQGAPPGQGAQPEQHARPGPGARLLVLLPEQAEPPPVTGTGPLALLVEDEPGLARLAARSLAGAGWRVLAADSAESALERLGADAAPQLVVTDLALPGLDGLVLLGRLRERWPDLPGVLTSGYAVPPTRLPPRTTFLAKPYALRDLLAHAAAQGG
ncbi:MAG: response regulator, partial [Janthinobacterium lividum]